MGVIESLLDPIPIPHVFHAAQRFEHGRIDDVEGELDKRLGERGVLDAVRPGARIAITVGSRGISNQPKVVRRLVERLTERGARPFVVPAMGSHGGATAEGQREMLHGMGFREDEIGCPIVSSMETVQIGTSANGLPVHIDKNADGADGIILLNRIKPHVAFRGPYESGLMKMLAIGLGKQHGADICHDLGFGKMAENIPAIGRVVLAKKNILFAIGLIENAYHETCRIVVLHKGEVESEEPKLQEEAKRLAPRLRFSELDVLIIDEIGKNISGTGFDTNLVGRYHTPFASGGPSITRVSVLDLTEQSHGNANGLGIVDFTTRRAFEKMKFDQTYPNSLTSTVPISVKIPMVLANDRQAIQAAIKTCNILDKTKVRLVRIKNTNEIHEIEVSESLRPLVEATDGLEAVGASYPLGFNAEGNLF